jgi:opacity protein-like surface antigen
MKKIRWTLFFSLFLFIGNLSAEAAYEIDVQARASAFFPSEGLFGKIYGTSMGCYAFEASTPCWESFESWMNLDWVSKKGQSTPLHSHTRISLVNFSLGIKYPYQISEDFKAYGGIGPSFGSVFVKNRMRDYRKKTSRFAMGGVLKTGIRYEINCDVFLDLFFDYLYQRCFHKDIGGCKLGLGVGYRF